MIHHRAGADGLMKLAGGLLISLPPRPLSLSSPEVFQPHLQPHASPQSPRAFSRSHHSSNLRAVGEPSAVGSVPACLPGTQPFRPSLACESLCEFFQLLRVSGNTAEGPVTESAALEVPLCAESTGPGVGSKIKS